MGGNTRDILTPISAIGGYQAALMEQGNKDHKNLFQQLKELNSFNQPSLVKQPETVAWRTKGQGSHGPDRRINIKKKYVKV